MPEDTALSERSQTQEDTSCMTPLIGGPQRVLSTFPEKSTSFTSPGREQTWVYTTRPSPGVATPGLLRPIQVPKRPL